MKKEFNGLKKPKDKIVGYTKSGRPLIRRIIPIIGSVAAEESQLRREKADERHEWRKQGKL